MPPMGGALDCSLRACWFNRGLVRAEFRVARLPWRLSWRLSWRDFRRRVERRASGMELPVLLGASRVGPLVVDLAELRHMLIGGSTGGGKSTLLRQAITGLAASLLGELKSPRLVAEGEGSGSPIIAGIEAFALHQRLEPLQVLAIGSAHRGGHHGRADFRESTRLAVVPKPHPCAALADSLPGVRRLHRKRSFGGAHHEPLTGDKINDLVRVSEA